MQYITCPDCKSSIPVDRELEENESIELMCPDCLLDIIVTKKNSEFEVKPASSGASYSDDNYGAFD